MATHSSVLAWRIPGTTEPGGLPSMGSHRVGHDWSDLAAAAAVVILILICKMILQTAHLKQSRGFTRWTEESSRLYSEIMDLGVLSCVWSSNEMNGFFFFFFFLCWIRFFFFFFKLYFNQLSTVCCAFVLSRFSHVWLLATPWTVAHRSPLPTGFSRQEYWSGLPCPPPGGLPNPGIKPASLTSPVLSGRQAGSLPRAPTGKLLLNIYWLVILSMLFYFHEI